MTPRRILRIARLEVARSVGSMDRRWAVAILVVMVGIGGMVTLLIDTNPTPGEGLYRVGIDSSDPYYEPVRAAPSLRPVPLDEGSIRNGELEVVVRDGRVQVRDTETGHAAATALKDAVVSYNDHIMRFEPDDAAAFPVVVSLQYAPRDAPSAGLLDSDEEQLEETVTESDTVAEPGDEATESGGQDGTTGTGVAPTAAEEPTATAETDGEAEDGVDLQPTTTAVDTDIAAPGGDAGGGPLDGLLGTTQSGTPGSISPPFPLRALLLAFAFLLPFNLIIQAYGGSVFAERINRRGEPLLVSPATPGDIVLGKTLPYLALAIAVTSVIALVVGAGVRSVVAITPLAVLFLGATFVAGLVARSYKELTFVTVTISVTVTAYAFVPAVFAEIHPIAAISPLSIVVDDLQSVALDPGMFVLATLPVSLAGVVLFVLGTAMVREEHMFTRRPLPAKLLDVLAEVLAGPWTVALWTALFVPFVFVAELFVVASLFVLPTSTSIPVLLAAIAVIEELAKSLHVFAGFERGRFERSTKTALVLGALSGFGFFLGEKMMAVTQLVGLPELDVGRAAFGPITAGFSPLLLLFAPLALHVTTAAMSAIGASRGRRAYAAGLGLAILVHVSYNLAVVSILA